jgi:hypothetical protein
MTPRHARRKQERRTLAASGAENYQFSISRRYFTSFGPPVRSVSFSCITPSRRATSV